MLKLRSTPRATVTGNSPATNTEIGCAAPSSRTSKSRRLQPGHGAAVGARHRGVDLHQPGHQWRTGHQLRGERPIAGQQQHQSQPAQAAAWLGVPRSGRWTSARRACPQMCSRTVPGPGVGTGVQFAGSARGLGSSGPDPNRRWVPYEFWLHRVTDHPGDPDRDLRREPAAGTGPRDRQAASATSRTPPRTLTRPPTTSAPSEPKPFVSTPLALLPGGALAASGPLGSRAVWA